VNKKIISDISRHPLIFIILMALGLRVITWYNTCIVNPDAIVYISQAKAIYYHQYSAILGTLSFFSIYSLCIALLFPLFSNWIVTAVFISICFGILTLIPLYFFVREYMEERYALLTILIISTIPVFVSRSVDIIKDPMYWFFLAMALSLSVRRLTGKQRGWAVLPLIFILFFLASIVRVEASVFFLVTLVFMVVCTKRLKTLLWLAIPLGIVLIFYLGDIKLFGISINKFCRFDYILTFVSGLPCKYRELRANIASLASHQDLTMRFFLLDARRDIWLIGLEKFFNSFLEGVAYLPGIICMVGIASLTRLNRDKKIIYCLILMASGFGLLYFYTLYTWILSYRYVILFIIPASVFMGLGLKKCSIYMKQRWGVSEIKTLTVLLAVILLVTLAKDFKPRRTNKIIYKKAGMLIALHKKNSQWVVVASNQRNQGLRLISFYANLNYPGVYGRGAKKLETIDGSSLQKLSSLLNKKNVNYYILTLPRQGDQKMLKKLLAAHLCIMSWETANKGMSYLIKWAPMYKSEGTNNQSQYEQWGKDEKILAAVGS